MKLQDLVITSARRYPMAPAIYSDLETLSYQELDHWSNTLAKELSALGVSSGDRVAIWEEKSYWVVIAMQAVLRLGATYVPLDPLCPDLRAKAILKDCRVRALVTTRHRALKVLTEELSGLPCLFLNGMNRRSISTLANQTTYALPEQSGVENIPAYILYTSGSTGTPKGICLTHRNALAFVDWACEALQPQSCDRFSSHAPFHFDLSVLDLYAPFLKGASVSLVSEGLAYSPKRLVNFIFEQKITHWYSVPSALILMIEQGGLLEKPLDSLRTLLFAGEPFPIKHLKRLKAHIPQARFHNLYGPTETNVCTSYEVDEISDDQIAPVPIGKACCGNEVWLSRGDGSRIHTFGEEGELFVRGPTVMSGYWGKPPVENQTYATGDIAKFTEEGNLVFIGRKDHQVKVKGFRIDLGEIEATLLRSPEIIEAVVVILGSGLKAKLFACLIMQNKKIPHLLKLKELCSKYLPPYMIVDGFKVFEEFPRTSTGKTDRKTLTEQILLERRKFHEIRQKEKNK